MVFGKDYSERNELFRNSRSSAEGPVLSYLWRDSPMMMMMMMVVVVVVVIVVVVVVVWSLYDRHTLTCVVRLSREWVSSLQSHFDLFWSVWQRQWCPYWWSSLLWGKWRARSSSV